MDRIVITYPGQTAKTARLVDDYTGGFKKLDFGEKENQYMRQVMQRN